MAGIEPATSAWKAEVLPLNYIRKNTFYMCAVNKYSSNCAIVKKFLTNLFGKLPAAITYQIYSLKFTIPLIHLNTL